MKVLPADGPNIAVVGIVRTVATSSRLTSWIQQVERPYKGRYVPAIGRFSPSPRIQDLEHLELDEQDLKDLRKCRSGDCELKLSAPEVALIRQRFDAAGPDGQPAAQQAFRAVVLNRALNYLRTGHDGMWYEDEERPVALGEEFLATLDPPMSTNDPLSKLGEHLRVYPRADRDAVTDTFLYWSKAHVGAKPSVSITHVTVVSTNESRLAALVAAAPRLKTIGDVLERVTRYQRTKSAVG